VKRLLLYVAAGLVVVALLLAAAWWWLTGTRGGAAFVLGQVEQRVERLAWDRLEGSLAGGLTLQDVAFAQGGAEVDVRRLELAVSVRALTPAVRIRRLFIDGVRVAPPPAPPGEATGDEPVWPVDLRAPLDVIVEAFELRDFRLVAPDSEPLAVDRLSLAGRYGDRLVIERLEIEMPMLRAAVNGRAGLSAPWPVDLDLEAAVVLPEGSEQALTLGVRGQLPALALTIAARGPVRLDGDVDIDGLPDTGAIQARLDLAGERVAWPALPASLRDFELAASGGPDDWQARLGGTVEAPELPPARLALEALGTGESVELQQGRIDVLDGRIDVRGRAELAETPVFRGRIELAGLDFTSLYPDWPKQARLAGGLDAAFDGRRLRLEDIALRAPPAPLRVEGSAGFDTADQALDVALEWDALTWPPVLDDSEPLFASESGTLSARGTLAEWRAELSAWMALPGMPRGRVELDANGDAESAAIRRGEVSFDGAGALRASGRLTHSPALRGRLDGVLEDFDPGIVAPQLPGRVDGQFVAALDQLAPLRASLDLQRLSGRLRQVALSGNGRLSVVDGAPGPGALELGLGENRLSVASGEGADWQVRLDAARLDQLWPDLAGALALEATARPAAGRADWTLDSPGLSFLDFRTGRIDAGGNLDWGEQPALETRLRAVDVDLNPWERLESLELTASGGCDQHRLALAIAGSRADVELRVSGRLPGCLEGPPAWQGELEQLTIADTPVGRWQLDTPLPVRLEDGRAQAGPGCLWSPDGPGRLCLNELDAAGRGRAVVAFNAVPADLLLLPADPVFTLDSQLRGLARVGWGARGLEQVESTLLLGPGRVRMLGDEAVLLGIGGADLALTSPTAGALEADLEVRLEEATRITARVRVPDLAAPASTRIDGQADLDLPNLAAFNRLVPQLDRLDGRIEGRLRVSGPLQQPDFEGRLAIHDGQLLHAPLGAGLEDLDIEIDADAEGGRLTGGFAAGEGRARLEGQWRRAGDAWRADASVRGERLRLFDADWLALTISPDLTVGLAPERLDLDGVLAVDRARLGLPPGAEQRIEASPDQVIVGAADAGSDGAGAEEGLPTRDIVGTVELRLGDDVRLAAAGMQTRLAGDLAVEWTPEAVMPTGRGVLRLVDGSYRAYGQNLEVTRGDVLFTGNPVDNPVLEIEAVRQIFGDPQVEQAGVRIRGPAQAPEITLFTAPPTSREKALAYILTGAEFDHAAGQGAFSVGFWVLPQLFVSYGLGLFDTGNVLAARWELSRRWGIRATSGERDTGADISFIIDR